MEYSSRTKKCVCVSVLIYIDIYFNLSSDTGALFVSVSVIFILSSILTTGSPSLMANRNADAITGSAAGLT